MAEENTENETPTNEGEETPETPTEEEETPETSSLSEEEIADLKKKADLADNYKIRAEKAEKKAKENKEEKEDKEDKEETNLSGTDLIYFAKADIHEDDIEEVREYAKFKNISVKEAHGVLKPILDTKEEQRKTAETTQTKANQRTSQKTNPQTVISKAEKGELPNEDDDAGIQALVDARHEQKHQHAAEDKKLRGI